MPIVAHPLWALEIIRPGIHWAPIVRLSTSWTDNRNWHVGKRVETHRPGREPGRDHPASIWAPSDNIGHCKTSGRRLNRVDLNHLLIKNESSVREILGRHRSVMHRERFQRCRGGLGLHRMPRSKEQPHAPGPRCRARTRRGTECQSPAMKNGRCRMHGGKDHRREIRTP